jgi:predicted DCC family thiol-disulfide oxidoreductase YuxK
MKPTGVRAAYSYKTDPQVPAFDDTGPIAIMDGECAICSTGARLIARFDRREEFRICRIQSETGSALLRHYGLDAADPDSWLYLVGGRAYSSLDGVIRVGRRIGGWGWLLQPLRLIPRPVQDWLYRRLARNRYRLFGKADICALPDPGLRARLMD